MGHYGQQQWVLFPSSAARITGPGRVLCGWLVGLPALDQLFSRILSAKLDQNAPWDWRLALQWEGFAGLHPGDFAATLDV